jgi:hypothetical protein
MVVVLQLAGVGAQQKVVQVKQESVELSFASYEQRW